MNIKVAAFTVSENSVNTYGTHNSISVEIQPRSKNMKNDPRISRSIPDKILAFCREKGNSIPYPLKSSILACICNIFQIYLFSTCIDCQVSIKHNNTVTVVNFT